MQGKRVVKFSLNIEQTPIFPSCKGANVENECENCMCTLGKIVLDHFSIATILFPFEHLHENQGIVLNTC